MEKVSGIYRIVCRANGRYYYGSSKNITLRWNRHRNDLRKNKHENSIIQRSWNKHGENSFIVEIIELVNPEKLLETEDGYLKKHIGNPNCMNISPTAFGGIANMGHYARSGPDHPFYGKKRPEFSKLMTGRKMSRLARKHQALAKIGNKNPMKRLENKLKNSIAHGATPVVLVSPTGEEFTVIGYSEFARQHGLQQSSLSLVIHNKRSHHKGWKLRNEYVATS